MREPSDKVHKNYEHDKKGLLKKGLLFLESLRQPRSKTHSVVECVASASSRSCYFVVLNGASIGLAIDFAPECCPASRRFLSTFTVL